MFFKKLLTVELEDFINYVVCFIEYYQITNSPMHQTYDFDRENISKSLSIVFNKKLSEYNYDSIELKYNKSGEKDE